MHKSAAEIIAQAEESILGKILSSAKFAEDLYKAGRISSATQGFKKRI